MFQYFLSVHYLFWIIASSICYAFGEFFSKKFALEPSIFYFVLVYSAYSFGVLAWLPAIMQRNQLSIVGVIWAVMSLLTTVLIGAIIFGERLSITGVLGILTALLSVILLSL